MGKRCLPGVKSNQIILSCMIDFQWCIRCLLMTSSASVSINRYLVSIFISSWRWLLLIPDNCWSLLFEVTLAVGGGDNKILVCVYWSLCLLIYVWQLVIYSTGKQRLYWSLSFEVSRLGELSNTTIFIDCNCWFPPVASSFYWSLCCHPSSRIFFTFQRSFHDWQTFVVRETGRKSKTEI